MHLGQSRPLNPVSSHKPLLQQPLGACLGKRHSCSKAMHLKSKWVLSWVLLFSPARLVLSRLGSHHRAIC